MLDDFLVVAPAEDEGTVEGYRQAEDIRAVLGIHDSGHDLTGCRPGPRPVEDVRCPPHEDPLVITTCDIINTKLREIKY